MRIPHHTFWYLAAAFALVHIALVNHFVPAAEVFSNDPIRGIDYDLHVGQIYHVVEALDEWGKSWSYNVSLLAGYPAGVITDSGSKGWQLYAYALYELGVRKSVAFNSFILLVMWSFPLSIYAASRNFSLPRRGSLLAAAMASCLLFFDSHVHWLWFVGMISWCGAASLSLLCLSLFHRWSRERTGRLALATAVLLSVSLLVHPYVFFVLGLPMAVIYLRAFRTLRWFEHLSVVSIVLLPLAANAYWLHNSWRHWHYILDSAVYAQASPEHLLFDFLNVMHSFADTGLIGTRTGFRFLFLALGIAGLCVWRARREHHWLPITTSVVALYGIAYFGGYLPGMQQTQPYRQVTPAMLFTILPAAALVVDGRLALAVKQLTPVLRVGMLVLGVALAQQLLATDVLYFFPGLVPEPVIAPDRKPPSVSKYGYPRANDRREQVPFYALPHAPAVEYGSGDVVRWIGENIPSSSRVLVKEPVLGERLVWHGRHEVMGGFFERNVQHVDANYFRAHLGKPVDTAQFRHYLRTYAIEWVVSQESDFDGQERLLELVETVHDRRIYRVIEPARRILQGSGTVRARTNTIEVRDSDPTQPLLLSYHWHPALRCKPDCKVERAEIDIDRVGFIRVPTPHPKTLTVWNSYENW